MWYITMLGDSAVLVPLGILLLLWIAVLNSRLAVRWIFAIAGAALILAASKLFYGVTDIGIPHIDFRMISGHTAISFAVWPVFVFLIFQAWRERVAYFAAGAALFLCGMIGYSRIQDGAHTLSEVLAAIVLGSSISWCFFYLWRKYDKRSGGNCHLPFAILSVLVIFICYGHTAPTSAWVDFASGWIKSM